MSVKVPPLKAGGSVPPFKAGSCKTLTAKGLSSTAGAATLYAFVDAACTVTEANENNNYGSLDVTVLPTPQAVLKFFEDAPGLAAVNKSPGSRQPPFSRHPRPSHAPPVHQS